MFLVRIFEASITKLEDTNFLCSFEEKLLFNYFELSRNFKDFDLLEVCIGYLEIRRSLRSLRVLMMMILVDKHSENGWILWVPEFLTCILIFHTILRNRRLRLPKRQTLHKILNLLPLLHPKILHNALAIHRYFHNFIHYPLKCKTYIFQIPILVHCKDLVA